MAREREFLCCRRLGFAGVDPVGQSMKQGPRERQVDWLHGTPAGPTLAHAARKNFSGRPEFEHFREVLARLRKNCPAAKPVVVRTAWLPPTTLGECSRRRERFVIRLNRHQSQEQAVETLCHEWAHALAWSYSLDKLARDPHVTSEQFEQASHDEARGCAYSKVWRAHLAAGRAGGRAAQEALRAVSQSVSKTASGAEIHRRSTRAIPGEFA